MKGIFQAMFIDSAALKIGRAAVIFMPQENLVFFARRQATGIVEFFSFVSHVFHQYGHVFHQSTKANERMRR